MVGWLVGFFCLYFLLFCLFVDLSYWILGSGFWILDSGFRVLSSRFLMILVSINHTNILFFEFKFSENPETKKFFWLIYSFLFFFSHCCFFSVFIKGVERNKQTKKFVVKLNSFSHTHTPLVVSKCPLSIIWFAKQKKTASMISVFVQLAHTQLDLGFSFFSQTSLKNYPTIRINK